MDSPVDEAVFDASVPVAEADEASLGVTPAGTVAAEAVPSPGWTVAREDVTM